MAHPPPCFGWRSAKCQLTGNLRLQTKRQRTESIQAYLFSPLLEAKLDRCSKLCATTLSLLDYFFFPFRSTTIALHNVLFSLFLKISSISLST